MKEKGVGEVGVGRGGGTIKKKRCKQTNQHKKKIKTKGKVPPLNFNLGSPLQRSSNHIPYGIIQKKI